VRNFSELAAPNNPVIIDVFPFNGDETTPGGGARAPASDFDGSNLLVTPPTANTLDRRAVDGRNLTDHSHK